MVEREVRTNLLYREFTRVYAGKVPDAKSLGRQALVNIAKSTIRIGQEPHVKQAKRLKKMYEITSIMLKDSLVAYQKEDLGIAKAVADLDNEVDTLYGEVIKDLFVLNNQQSENYDQIVQMLFINRFLERAADHVTNIAENIFYLVKGKQYDLNE